MSYVNDSCIHKPFQQKGMFYVDRNDSSKSKTAGKILANAPVIAMVAAVAIGIIAALCYANVIGMSITSVGALAGNAAWYTALGSLGALITALICKVAIESVRNSALKTKEQKELNGPDQK